MKTVKKIFVDDVVGLAKNFFALVIVIGICFLPALYAWFNIYSNWDPYGNTGALKFAAVSLDKGFTDENGEYHNQGDTIIENLHENTAVDWQFVDSEKEATDGVYSGEYYAAVVIDEDFTYNMYNVLTEEVDRPILHFYENQKKNPVATKISDTVVQSLQNNINVAFTEVVVSEVFSNASNFSDELQEQGGVDRVIDKLKTLSADLTTYQNAFTTILDNDAKLQSALAVAKQDAKNIENQAKVSADAVKNSQAVSAQTATTVNTYSKDVKDVIDIINAKAGQMNNYLDVAAVADNVEQKADALKKAAVTASEIEIMIYSLPDEIGKDKIDEIKDSVLPPLKQIQNFSKFVGRDTKDLDKVISDLENIDSTIANSENKVAEAQKKKEAIEQIDVAALVNQGEDKVNQEISNSKDSAIKVENIVTGDLNNKINSGLNSLTGMLGNTNSLLNNVGETFGNLVVMFNAIDNSVDCANTSIQKTNEAIVYVNGRLIDVINEVEQASESEKLQVLVNALSGDPEVYGKFFSTPVNVVTEAVYPIENYGSAVAPFYSTLAFWVGALILTAIIKVKPDKSKYPDASERQLYFGRYALYWVLGQLQSIIIVSGDIYLLHVQCVHPLLFFVAGSFIATTFTILIYSLVVTWGDAGKALAVVLVVIQIAGSSGTYPIELLPEFFKKVYIFFPFPYAINAIRECLCGMYKLDYLKYLGTLVVFMVVSLIIGLLIRIPFEPINHYMEERMEDTEMM
ncbi:YhgE/Pip domain-containing protein [Pseudobutyrivibrio ruminis]|uniref:YhgE/Pip domain-containing protein n=1 Tax=Pseudobutyrivibrio ruminis TaxID=46206 RepID=UPI000426B21F|nr:YhgE/Pip domain-containing protein [Pseudobutyrivibrio ruminis]